MENIKESFEKLVKLKKTVANLRSTLDKSLKDIEHEIDHLIKEKVRLLFYNYNFLSHSFINRSISG